MSASPWQDNTRHQESFPPGPYCAPSMVAGNTDREARIRICLILRVVRRCINRYLTDGQHLSSWLVNGHVRSTTYFFFFYVTAALALAHHTNFVQGSNVRSTCKCNRPGSEPVVVSSGSQLTGTRALTISHISFNRYLWRLRYNILWTHVSISTHHIRTGYRPLVCLGEMEEVVKVKLPGALRPRILEKGMTRCRQNLVSHNL